MFADVRLEQDKEWPISHKLFINGVNFANTTCSLHVEADSLPEVTVKMIAKAPEFSGKASVEFDRETIKCASCILRLELLKHGDLYDAFLASIRSAVEEQFGASDDELIKSIMDRVIGEN